MSAVYLWKEGGKGIRKYERRTTICSAHDEQAARERLLEEARVYSVDGIEFLGEYLIQEIDDPPGDEPVEVAHEMTLGIDPSSGQTIDPDEFLRTKWDCARIENCESLGIEHSWYNQDGKRSACHNCEVVREGQLWPGADSTIEEAEQGVVGNGDARA